MLPRFSSYNQADAVISDPEQFSDHRKSYHPRLVHCSNLNHLFFSKFCASLIGASKRVKPAFISAINQIFLVRSNENVIRVDANPVVTLMTRLKTFWNLLPVCVLPRKAVGYFHCRFFLTGAYRSWVWRKTSVTVMGFVPNPRPALRWISLFNVSPESDRGFGFSYHMGTEYDTA